MHPHGQSDYTLAGRSPSAHVKSPPRRDCPTSTGRRHVCRPRSRHVASRSSCLATSARPPIWTADAISFYWAGMSRDAQPIEHPAVDQGTLAQIRASVGDLCKRFAGEYWRDLDRRRAYPTEFVQAFTESGYLGVLIPEECGGSGLGLTVAAAILEEVHASGGNAAALHAQMYTMGTVLRHGSAEQKARFLPDIAAGRLRLQAFGVTEPTAGTDTTSIRTTAERRGDVYVVNGQKIWTSRAQHSDLMLLLARTTPADQVEKKSDGLSVFLVDMREARGRGMEIRPIRAMINHATTEIFFDDLKIPAENLLGEEGGGFRYILDGMNAERILI